MRPRASFELPLGRGLAATAETIAFALSLPLRDLSLGASLRPFANRLTDLRFGGSCLKARPTTFLPLRISTPTTRASRARTLPASLARTLVTARLPRFLPPTRTRPLTRTGGRTRLRRTRRLPFTRPRPFAGAEETFPFGPKTSVFKAGGKMFALSQLGADSLRVSLKCEPQLAKQLREAHTAVIPGYHLNKRHWNTVIIDGSLPDGIICEMIEDSYDLVVSQLPRGRQRNLGWSGGA